MVYLLHQSKLITKYHLIPVQILRYVKITYEIMCTVCCHRRFVVACLPRYDDKHASGDVDGDHVVRELPLEDQIDGQAAVLTCKHVESASIPGNRRYYWIKIMSDRFPYLSDRTLHTGGFQYFPFFYFNINLPDVHPCLDHFEPPCYMQMLLVLLSIIVCNL